MDQWENQGAVFDSGFDDTVIEDTSQNEGLAAKLGLNTGPGGTLAYVRGNVTYLVLLAMAVTYIAQLVVLAGFGQNVHDMIFVFSPENPFAVWTWVTSIFAHSPTLIFHIVFNGIVIYFFGRLVEQFIGSKQFVLLFVASGVLAGAAQVAYQIFLGSGAGVVGASGAALALLGVVTVLRPDLEVYLLFVIPMPIWVLTGGTVALSTLFILAGQAGGVAHVAHIVGVLIGLAYGRRVKGKVQLPGQVRLGGGGRRPPGGPGRRP
jgi:membrane associated rhomboid family serine protease